MGNSKDKTIRVRKDSLEKARGLPYGYRLCDWEIFEFFLSFCEKHKKEFDKFKEQWQKKK